MGKEVSPTGFRLDTTQTWSARWFTDKDNYEKFLREDEIVRDKINGKFERSAIEEIEIERSTGNVNVTIFTPRPGLIIGRNGENIRELEDYFKKNLEGKVEVDVKEVRDYESQASLMAKDIADQIEKRAPFRGAMKRAANKIFRHPDVEGVKIKITGRLNGADMSRSEWLQKGPVPLQTMRADIDYHYEKAVTNYGSIGVKVWIYKGEVFEEDQPV